MITLPALSPQGYTVLDCGTIKAAVTMNAAANCRQGDLLSLWEPNRTRSSDSAYVE